MRSPTLLSLLISLLLAAPALAADIHWNAAVSGDWSDDALWTGGAAPAPGDNVFIDVPGDYTVTLDVDADVANLDLGAATGAQQLAATSRVLTVNGTLAITDGGELSLAACQVLGAGDIDNAGTLRLQHSNTLNVDLHNAATMEVRHTGNLVNGAFTTTGGSLLNLEIVQNADPQITFASGFTNHGTIELDQSIGHGRNTRLAVTTGELVNAGSIAASGSNGTRTIDAPLRNLGAIDIDYATTISHGSETITNEAAIAIAASQTLTVTGDFVHASGSIDGPGACHFSGATATFETAALPAAELRFTSSELAAPAPIDAPATVTLTSSNTVSADLDMSGTLNVTHTANQFTGQLTTTPGALINLEIVQNADPQITFANGFTNHGTIELDQAIGHGRNTRLAVTTGELVNAGSIAASGSNGTRTIDAPLRNLGAIDIDYATTISHGSEMITNEAAIDIASGITLTVTGDFVHASGSIDGPGVCHFSGATATFQTAGLPTGPLQFTSSELAAAAPVSGAGTYILQSNNTVSADVDLSGTLHVFHAGNQFTGQLTTTPSAVIDLEIVQNSDPQITFATGFTNQGIIELDQSIGHGRHTRLAVTTGELVNTGSIAASGSNGTRTIDAPLRNQGTIDIDFPTTISHGSETITNEAAIAIAASQTLTVTGDFVHASGSIDGPGVCHFSGATATFETAALPVGPLQFTSGELAAPSPVSGAGTYILQSNNTISADLDLSGTLRVFHAGNQFTGQLTTTPGAVIDLEIAQNTDPQITFASGFINQGLIELDQVIGYGRHTRLAVTTGELVNIGSIAASGSNGTRTIDAPLRNLGTIDIDYPTTIQHGSETITNSATIDIAGGITLTVTGDFVHAAGSIDGPGVCHFSNATTSFETPALPMAELRFTGSELAAPSSIDAPATVTLTSSNTISADLSLSGTLNVTHTANQFTGQLTTTPSALINLEIIQNADPQITFASGFINQGTIELDQAIGHGRHTRLAVTTGELVNTGSIATSGSNGTRTIDAPLRNQGAIDIDYPTTIQHGSETITNAGAIEIAGGITLTVTGDFVHAAGSIDGPGACHFSSATTTFEPALLPAAELVFTSSTLGSTVVLTSTGTLTLLPSNTITASIENQGTLNVHHTNNLVMGQFANLPGGLLNLEIDRNADPQITFDQPFANHGAIELDQSIGYGRTTALGFSTGTLVNMPGGTLLVDGTNGTRGIFADFENRGSVSMAYALSIDGASAYNAPGGVFEGDGSLTLVGCDLVNGGVLSPGVLPDAGQLAAFGNVAQENQGVYRVEIGGLAQNTEHDNMTVVGDLSLDGTLDIVLTGGFVPVYGDSFVIVNHGLRTGEFSAIGGLDIGGGLFFQIAYRDDYIVLAAGDFLPPETHVITASAGDHGEISPAGDVYVPDHGEVTFAVNPDPGYGVGDVLVDGISVGPAALYHFGDVTADHDIEAFFVPGDFDYDQVDIGSSTDMNDATWGTGDFGVVVGDGGEIHVTNDGGDTWWLATHGATSDMMDVEVIGDTVVVVGTDGTICVSEDGGLTWVMSPSGTTEVLHDVHMVHGSYGYAVGANGTLLCWDGSTWIPQVVPGLPAGADLASVTVVEGIVYVVGSNGLVITHAGPGSDWVVLWSGQSFDFQGVSFHDADNGTAVGTVGTVWITGDGGVTWSSADVNYQGTLHDCVHYSATSRWLIGDDGTFIRTLDDGQTWEHVEFSLGDAFHGIGVKNCRGLITGPQGVTYRFQSTDCVEEPGGARGTVRLAGAGVADVVVQLLDIDGNPGVLDANGQPVQDLLTDGNGDYAFPDLVADVYTLAITPPAGTSSPEAAKQVLLRPGSFTVVDFQLEDSTPVDGELPPASLDCAVYPNPFNPATTFRFELPEPGAVHLDIFDVAGRRVARLLDDEFFPAGSHERIWRGEADGGRRLASGVYYYRLRIGGDTRQGKLTLLK